MVNSSASISHVQLCAQILLCALVCVVISFGIMVCVTAFMIDEAVYGVVGLVALGILIIVLAVLYLNPTLAHREVMEQAAGKACATMAGEVLLDGKTCGQGTFSVCENGCAIEAESRIPWQVIAYRSIRKTNIHDKKSEYLLLVIVGLGSVMIKPTRTLALRGVVSALKRKQRELNRI